MSKKHLVIVESPAKAKTIGKYLGSEYTVKACMGHLRDLPKSTIGVDIENDFIPEYKPIRGKEERSCPRSRRTSRIHRHDSCGKPCNGCLLQKRQKGNRP